MPARVARGRGRPAQRMRRRPAAAARAQPPSRWNTMVPQGWQSITAHTPTRFISCEMSDCKYWRYGWWEKQAAVIDKQGRIVGMKPDVAGWGELEPEQIQPGWIWHEPGIDCCIPHKVWDERFDPVFSLRMPGMVKPTRITTSEAFGRADEGAHTAQRIQAGSI